MLGMRIDGGSVDWSTTKYAVRVGEGRVWGRKTFREMIQDGREAVVFIQTGQSASGELYMASEIGDTLTTHWNSNL